MGKIPDGGWWQWPQLKHGPAVRQHVSDLVLARRRDPAPAVTILTPDALRLQHEPQADCARYDSLRRAS
ncbi:hypothetical protein NKH16_31215 [Mesorhizobium sp. M1307]|uniref:hypothetical protein n=1 Tax=Mesorhizobium sp. M1307 TaxID=2957079 RepID=UPI00333B16C9